MKQIDRGLPLPGPAPRPEGLRRRRNAPMANVRHIPAGDYDGPVPEWPLKTASEDELATWAKVWTKPQAHAWAADGYAHVVARYCRLLVECEAPDARITKLIEVRMLEDRLGLSA